MHKDESHAEELIYAVKTFSLCQHFACQDGFKSMCGSGVKSPSYYYWNKIRLTNNFWRRSYINEVNNCTSIGIKVAQDSVWIEINGFLEKKWVQSFFQVSQLNYHFWMYLYIFLHKNTTKKKIGSTHLMLCFAKHLGNFHFTKKSL